jgi:5-hydroxyisourate hydrolase-like protein (transthyretin family)
MKGVRLKALGVALLGALALMFAGCGQQGGGSQAPTKGSLTVNVIPADAQVQVTGPGSFSQSFTGGKTLTDLDPGDYTVQASKAGYFTASATHKVEAGKITPVVLSLLPVPASGPTEGKVAVLVVNGNGSPISGATVSDGTNTATTNAQGRADLTYTAAGTYAISVNAAGYLGAAQLASVELGKTVALTFKLQPQPAPPPPRAPWWSTSTGRTPARPSPAPV